MFALEGDYLGNEVIKCGNINDTYRMDLRTGSGMKSYIVQRINHNVFRHPERIISNVCAVTEHIAHKLEQACDRDIGRKVLRLYVTTEGKHLYISPDGDYWRVMNFIYNAESHDRGGVRLLHKTGEAVRHLPRASSPIFRRRSCTRPSPTSMTPKSASTRSSRPRARTSPDGWTAAATSWRICFRCGTGRPFSSRRMRAGKFRCA